VRVNAQEWFAVAIGAVGAIVGLPRAWTSFSSWRADRPRLKFELALKRFTPDESGQPIERSIDSLDGLELHLVVTSLGRRPLVLDTWCGRAQWATSHVTLDDTVNRGKALTELESRCRLVTWDFLGLFGAAPPCLWITSSSGRIWDVPPAQVEEVARMISRLRVASSPRSSF
jgi:hypothetical protein